MPEIGIPPSLRDPLPGSLLPSHDCQFQPLRYPVNSTGMRRCRA